MVTLTPSYSPPDGGTSAVHPTPSVEERLVFQPVLTLLVALLIPCVVLLFLLNCFLLFHRLPAFSLKKRGKRRGAVRSRYPCLRVSQDGRTTIATTSSRPLCKGCHGSGSVQGLEAALAKGEGGQGSRNRPPSRDGSHKANGTVSNPGSCSLRPACVISVPCCSARRPWNPPACVRPPERTMGWVQVGDGVGSHGVESQGTESTSELEARYNAVPPNSSEAETAPGVTPKVKFPHKTSTQRKAPGGSVFFTTLDSMHFDQASCIPHGDTSVQLGHTLPGPGLDSDFGASAGISMHILSSDSDTCSQSWALGMEWDYYDPCYMRSNRHRRDPRWNHHPPMLCSKQYWV
ncbi:protein huluwa-like [Ascaphus truei]|uniref:protein huluwa-like n=1 Tax=Ascaphus truei TaxID=8439 RepID=UPI003F5932EF